MCSAKLEVVDLTADFYELVEFIKTTIVDELEILNHLLTTAVDPTGTEKDLFDRYVKSLNQAIKQREVQLGRLNDGVPPEAWSIVETWFDTLVPPEPQFKVMWRHPHDFCLPTPRREQPTSLFKSVKFNPDRYLMPDGNVGDIGYSMRKEGLACCLGEVKFLHPGSPTIKRTCTPIFTDSHVYCAITYGAEVDDTRDTYLWRSPWVAGCLHTRSRCISSHQQVY
jgi:hypothetical protein